MSIKQISVFLENQPGALNALTGVLTQHEIDIRALSLAEASDFGIVRLIVDDVYKTTTVLKDAGYIHSITTVIGAEIPDVPGGLNKLLHILTEANVNVEYMYAFLGRAGHAYMIIHVQDVQAASSALNFTGIRLADQDEISKL